MKQNELSKTNKTVSTLLQLGVIGCAVTPFHYQTMDNLWNFVSAYAIFGIIVYTFLCIMLPFIMFGSNIIKDIDKDKYDKNVFTNLQETMSNQTKGFTVNLFKFVTLPVVIFTLVYTGSNVTAVLLGLLYLLTIKVKSVFLKKEF